MDNDEPTEWPGSDFSDSEFGDGDDAGLDATDVGDDGIPGADLAYDPPDSDVSPDPDGDPGSAYPEPGFDPAGYDADPEAGVEPELTGPGDDLDALPGTDPDADPVADDESWTADPFPAPLDLEQPPAPVDGMPWSDPSLLGDPDAGPLGDPAAGSDDTPPVSDLYAYDGSEPPADGSDPWRSLAGSEDPATSSLARFWGARS